MNETFTLVLITALTTAVTTLVLGYVVYLLVIRKKMERRMMEMADIIQDRVRRGALEAGEELLPKFREKVTEGFKQALREWSASDFRTKARTGMSMVEESLNSLLSGGRARGGDDRS